MKKVRGYARLSESEGMKRTLVTLSNVRGGHPEWHIKGDVLEIINGWKEFHTMDGKSHFFTHWDLIVAHPPCTYLTVSGNRWFDVNKYGKQAEQRYKDRYKAIVFFMQMVCANSEQIAVENPIGIMSTAYRKPDQVIQPYQFGDPVRKSTCLWLKGLPPLMPTNVVEPNIIKDGKTSYSGPAYYAKDENGKILGWNDPRTAVARSKTYPGLAKAMAEQWG